MKTFIIIVTILASNTALGSSLIYSPTNPAFGGAPSYGAYYLNSAQAQDTLEDPNAVDPLAALNRDPLDNFEDSLNRQVLSQLARRILNEVFGEEGLGDGGTFRSGDSTVEVRTDDPTQLVIVITDGSGGETIIKLPYF